MSTLVENMVEAWTQRGGRALGDVLAAVKAPALFTNEWAARAAREVKQARAALRRWSS